MKKDLSATTLLTTSFIFYGLTGLAFLSYNVIKGSMLEGLFVFFIYLWPAGFLIGMFALADALKEKNTANIQLSVLALIMPLIGFGLILMLGF